MTANPAMRSLVSITASLFLLGCASSASAALLSERDATAAGQALVEAAAGGRVDEAFKAANALRRSDDAVFADALSAREKAVGVQMEKLGGLSSPIRLAEIEPTIFSGCIRREYRAHFAGGDQRWLLKFRRTSQGWALADLEVVGS